MDDRNRQPTALVLEHDMWARRFTSDLLASQGYAVLGASNGASGLRLAQEHPCDVIFLGLELPEITGIEVLERLKALDSTRAIPVIVLGDSPAGQPLAIEGCVPKPLEKMRVMSEIGRCLGPFSLAAGV